MAAWCGLIFWFSDQPDLRVSSSDAIDLVLRKSAHIGVFGVLAVLLIEAIRGAAPLRPWLLGAAWLLTFAYAASDEWHQTFVKGRAGRPSDVAIDMIGATIAVAAWALIHRRRAARSTVLQEHSP